MRVDELEARLRPYETASDRCVPPGFFMVARLDGRGFTRLTKERRADFERPFDERFRDMMVATAQHLMSSCGFTVVHGYTQSDEISLLFHPRERAFGRKLRKFVSVLAGEASARFSLLIGDHGVFDCRISELPSPELVGEYFRWRSEDAARNALGAHCYWALRKAGKTEAEATAALSGLAQDAKHELLFGAGTNFNDLPAWQKRGVGLAWEAYNKDATHPRTGELVQAVRRRIGVEYELPLREAYAELVRARLAEALAAADDGA